MKRAFLCKLGPEEISSTKSTEQSLQASIFFYLFSTLTRLAGLSVNEEKVREVITTRTIRETLEISDVMLKIFHMAIRTNPEWAKQALSEELANTSTEQYKLFKKFTGNERPGDPNQSKYSLP